MNFSNGVSVEEVTGEEIALLKKLFKGIQTGLVTIGENKTILPSHYKEYGQKYLDFKLRGSDVVVLTYPKCGTTWMQEILWTMCHNPDLNHPEQNSNLSFRSPFLEFDTLVADISKVNGPSPAAVEALKKLSPDSSIEKSLFFEISKHVPDRRIIKTHLPFTLMPENMLDTCKVVYVARNPKDAVVSYLHHNRLIKVHDFKGTDEEFIDLFCKGKLFYGSYDKHLSEAWQRYKNPNLLILFYEDLKKDVVKELNKLNTFLGTNLSAQQIQNVADHTTFNKMKKREPKRLTENKDSKDASKEGHGVPQLFNDNKDKNSSFYRKGEAGSWKTDLKPELHKKLDNWIAQKLTPDVFGLSFSYGL